MQLRALADKAAAVRKVRDRELSAIRNDAFGEEKPARGEHNPSAELGLDVVPKDHPARVALEKALSALPPGALRELWAVTLVARGEYALNDWDRAMAEAMRRTELDASQFMGMADLHDHLMKAVYEIERR